MIPVGQSIDKSKEIHFNPTCYHHIFLLFFLSLFFLAPEGCTLRSAAFHHRVRSSRSGTESEMSKRTMHQHQDLSRHRHFSCAVRFSSTFLRVRFVHPRSKIPSIPFMTDILHPRRNEWKKGCLCIFGCTLDSIRDVASWWCCTWRNFVITTVIAKIANENRIDSGRFWFYGRGDFIFSFLSLVDFVGRRNRSIRPDGLFSFKRRERCALNWNIIYFAHWQTTINRATMIIVSRIKIVLETNVFF